MNFSPSCPLLVSYIRVHVLTLHRRMVIERHRTILGIARSLRFQAAIPLWFWGECVTTTVYLLNRTPSKLLHFKSCFEILFNRPPSLFHIRVFGCLSYASSTRPLDKYSARTLPGVLMGYSVTQKGYNIYDIHSKSFFTSRNIFVQEAVFPFLHVKSIGSQLFPILNLPVLSIVPSSPSHSNLDVSPVQGEVSSSL